MILNLSKKPIQSLTINKITQILGAYGTNDICTTDNFEQGGLDITSAQRAQIIFTNAYFRQRVPDIFTSTHFKRLL